MIAHISGVPVEELAPLLAGASTSAVFVRIWLSTRVKRKRANND